jgi:[protein-PII] uridylyltransferase
MDTFTVEPLGAESREPMDPQKIAEMERDFRAILEGTLSVKELLSKRMRPPLGAHRTHSQVKPRVTIDNRASDFYTVVEIRAADRLGLLFAVTSALAKLELGVHVAIVDTRKGRVIDVFYVQDSGGQKILEKERLSQIEATLYGVLERLETVGPWAFLE